MHQTVLLYLTQMEDDSEFKRPHTGKYVCTEVISYYMKNLSDCRQLQHTVLFSTYFDIN
jgi:hypothetical protein